MKVLFAASENAWEGVLGAIRKRLPDHQFDPSGGFRVESLAGYDVLIPTMAEITAELLDTADRLQLIQQCGAGVERIDLAAARERNIPVANVPSDVSGNADSVAELGIYLMIGLARDAKGMAKSLAEGRIGTPMGRALSGRTVGLVGVGGIGRALIPRLRAFHMNVIGLKRRNPKQAEKELGLPWVGGPDDLPELCKRSDFVVLCLPQTPETVGFMDGKAISAMKSSAFLVNLSRGGVVDRKALADALRVGSIAGAGLDVFWEEPPHPTDPIFQFNVIATPHVAGATDISARGIMEGVVDNLQRLAAGSAPINIVNDVAPGGGRR